MVLDDMCLLLQHVASNTICIDSFVWWRDNSSFLVNSSDVRMLELCNEGLVLEAALKRENSILWKTKAPIKILIFC